MKIKTFIVLICLVLASCGQKKSANIGIDDDKYSSVSLKRFSINGLPLITTRDSLTDFLGTPNTETYNYAPSTGDTLRSLLYMFGESEMMFSVQGDSVLFSSIFFQGGDYIVKNKIGSFSRKTKLDVMKVVFSDSYNSRISSTDGTVAVQLKLDELDNASVRFEFMDDHLISIQFLYFSRDSSP